VTESRKEGSDAKKKKKKKEKKKRERRIDENLSKEF
jgi:hypothetical protein